MILCKKECVVQFEEWVDGKDVVDMMAAARLL